MAEAKMDLPSREREYLRELARRQAEIAALPIMEKRRQMWYTLNDEGNGTPPVVVETWTFDRDFMPESVYRCETTQGRRIESQMLANIRNHELIDDDKVIPDTYDISWFVDIDRMGVKIETESVKDGQGVATGYHFKHPIKDLKRDMQILKPPRCSVDRNGTLARKEFLEELFGDLLPVKIRSGVYGSAMLTYRVIELMGMEAFYTAMYDSPDETHQLMKFLQDGCLTVMNWAEYRAFSMPT